MAQNWVLRHYPDRDRIVYPSRWTDEYCLFIFLHMQMLERYGFKVHWCCGIVEAVARRDFTYVRHWIDFHDHVIRRAMCYDVEYSTPNVLLDKKRTSW